MVQAVSRWVLGVGLVAAVGLSARADDPKAELLKLNSVTGDEAQTARVIQLAKNKDAGKKLVAEAKKMMEAAKGMKSPFNFTACQILGRTATVLRDYDTAELFYKHNVDEATKLDSPGKVYQAYGGLIDVYSATRNYSQVIDACERLLELKGAEAEKRAPFVLEQLIRAKARLGKTDEALANAEALVTNLDRHWFALDVKGAVLHEAGKTKEAIAVYKEVMEKLDADKGLDDKERDRLKDGTRYVMSGLYVDAKEVDKAAEQLQALIKSHPDTATYKNDLGFIWADADKNLAESEKLVRAALDLDKKAQEKLKEEGKLDEVKPNAAYLDSLGWVLFKQKKYKDALKPLLEATADEDGQNIEILDHLADCYMALGQKAEAVAAWEKALKMKYAGNRDKERRKIVADKLKKAKAAD
jgi:tetratricopeptide (TPR) repeat protein